MAVGMLHVYWSASSGIFNLIICTKSSVYICAGNQSCDAYRRQGQTYCVQKQKDHMENKK